MAYSTDWIAKIITIPVGDLTLVSGTRYSLSMKNFLIEIRRIESAFTEGLWAPQILRHTNPELDFAGADYAGFDKIINDYQIEFGVGPTRVDLIGSNNNIIDVFIPTGISIVPSNTAGLQLVTVETGTSGLTQEESDAILTNIPQIQTDVGTINTNVGLLQTSISNMEVDINQLQTDVSTIESITTLMIKFCKNKKEVKKMPDNKWYLFIYDDDDTTPIIQKWMTDKDQSEINDLITGVMARESKSIV